MFSRGREPFGRRAPALLLAALLSSCGALYAGLAPSAINGDGVGYLKRLAGGPPAPGHPAYLALARLSAGDASTALEAAARLRWLSLLATLAALGLFAVCSREIDPRGRWLTATALLAASFAVARAATQVEVYAPALAASVAALYCLLRGRRTPLWLLLAACAVALATLLHLTLGLLVAPLALLAWRWRGAAWAAAAATLALTLIGLGLFLFARSAGHLGIPAMLRWYLAADHGLPYPLRATTPAVAVWGLARSVVAAPYLHQAGAVWAGLLGAGAVLAFGGLLSLARGARRPPGLGLLTASWCGPLALFGLLFYPSDTERWIFVLPLLALYAAQFRWRRAWILPLALAAVSLAHLAPRALERQAVTRARSAERWLRPTDLVISPGHGWSEQLGLGMRRPPRRRLLVSLLASARDRPAALRRLRAEIRERLRARRRVYVTRIAGDGDPRGFKELARWGLDRRRYRALFAPFVARPLAASGARTDEATAALWQLGLRRSR